MVCGRPPSVEEDIQWKTTFGGSLRAASFALRHFSSVGTQIPLYKKNAHMSKPALH